MAFEVFDLAGMSKAQVRVTSSGRLMLNRLAVAGLAGARPSTRAWARVTGVELLFDRVQELAALRPLFGALHPLFPLVETEVAEWPCAVEAAPFVGYYGLGLGSREACMVPEERVLAFPAMVVSGGSPAGQGGAGLRCG